MRIAWHSRQSAHEHLCRAFFMQRHLPQLPRHTSRPTETDGVSREYERGMMHTYPRVLTTMLKLGARGLTARCISGTLSLWVFVLVQ